jgi:hypothetical protein
MKIAILLSIAFLGAYNHNKANDITTIKCSSELVISESIRNNIGLTYNNFSYSNTDTIPIIKHILPKDSKTEKIIKENTSTDTIASSKKTAERTIRIDLAIPASKRYISWRFNSKYLNNQEVPVDTSLWMSHLFYPQQKYLESYTFLGNLGSPSEMDHFFTRKYDHKFLFAQHYSDFLNDISEVLHYNVKSPFTHLFYSTAGGRLEAEQAFKVLHTQNANRYINFGVLYEHFGTKGVYKFQETRNNSLIIFGSYNKGNFNSQISLANKVFRNQENGGIETYLIFPDTDTLDTKLIPVILSQAKSVLAERSISAIASYTLVNINKKIKNDSSSVFETIKMPLISVKLLVSSERFSRNYSDLSPNVNYYKNFFINSKATNDSVSLINLDVKALVEINQFAKIPLMPGLRGWIGFDYNKYYFFKPQDFIYSRDDDRFSSAHIGVSAFSESPFISYQGSIRYYVLGYRSQDKIVNGEIRLSPWKNLDMPQLKGRILVSEATPNIFLNTFYSNNFKWETSFTKEKRFLIGGSLEAQKWFSEIGYNLIHIKDYIYFAEDAQPLQADNVTITSAYLQGTLKFFKGLNFFNRIVWQVNSNSDVLSLPNFIGFSTLFYETEVVKNALTAQLGFNVTYRSKFFANAYQPAIGQFYNQRVRLLGGYPVVDLFANFKWKRAIIFTKYEHANQGYPNNEYYSAFSYPINPRIFKFGVSWIFYN